MTLIDRIIRDHEQLETLLNWLDEGVEDLRSGGEQGQRVMLILDAIRYLRDHSDRCHHPLEARLMSRIRPRLAEASQRAALDNLEQGHERIDQLTRELHDRLELFLADSEESLGALLVDCKSYSVMLRDHLSKENKSLLPAMENYWTEDDEKQVSQTLEDVPDPLFGPHIWTAFEALHHSLMGSKAD